MRLGIMGGTFDPIHYGHLFIAEEARTRFRLQQILFIPNGEPPHKQDYQVTSASRRYSMAMIAVHGNSAFSCSPIEVERAGPSYAAETLVAIHDQQPHSELFYITGIDAISDVLNWHQHSELFRLAKFIAAARPGYPMELLKDRLPSNYLERILPLVTTSPDISATEIRRRALQNLTIRYLTPDGVVDYIHKHRLYRTDNIRTMPQKLKG